MDEKRRIKKKRATVERQESTKDSDAAAAKGVLQPLVRNDDWISRNIQDPDG
ncbi:MAG TPA: hypothetical protein VFK06_03605 [Candidatus Angelobacter sp.]|nr:hypothetical protein [Candidatus Angelobacter sp.]